MLDLAGAAPAALERAYPRLRVMARVVRARGPIAPLDVAELVQVGALAYLEAYPKSNGANPNGLALRRAEWAMRDAIAGRLGLTGMAAGRRHASAVGWSSAVDAALAAQMREPGTCLPRRVKRAIRSLRNPYRRLLWAVYVGHETQAEIAAATGANTNTLATQHRRGVALLRGKLAGGRVPGRNHPSHTAGGVGLIGSGVPSPRLASGGLASLSSVPAAR